jgi:peptidoglycan hydrolase-like protein with peptidoglycan-binding domain
MMKMAVTYKLEEIKRGDKGPSVFLVQQMLKAREIKPGVPFYRGELDWEFGPATERAVKDYQTLRIAMGAKIGGADGKADGEVGPATWNDLLGLAKI